MNSFTDNLRYEDSFGFTESEVVQVLLDHDLLHHLADVRENCGGYLIGSQALYRPYTVMQYCDGLLAEPQSKPRINTDKSICVLDRLMYIAYSIGNRRLRKELELLVAGEPIIKKIKPVLTYQTTDENLDHLWSLLFMMGLLTYTEKLGNNVYKIVLPNKFVQNIVKQRIELSTMKTQ
jgi:hypothetical protein